MKRSERLMFFKVWRHSFYWYMRDNIIKKRSRADFDHAFSEYMAKLAPLFLSKKSLKKLKKEGLL